MFNDTSENNTSRINREDASTLLVDGRVLSRFQHCNVFFRGMPCSDVAFDAEIRIWRKSVASHHVRGGDSRRLGGNSLFQVSGTTTHAVLSCPSGDVLKNLPVLPKVIPAVALLFFKIKNKYFAQDALVRAGIED